MPEQEIARLVDEWWHARVARMTADAILDASRVLRCTDGRSHVPFPPEGGSFPLPCGRVARHSSPPDAGPAA